MKETYYFSHDYNASQDPKIFNMMSELGWEGYGLFWAIIEKLAEANGKLSLNDIKGFAFAWKIDSTIIKSLVNDFQLFDNDNEFFWSNRLIEHLNNRQKMANIRSKAGKIGGLASAKQRSSNRQAIVKQNQAKERKGKESKIKEITIMQPAVAEQELNNQITTILKKFETINPFIKKMYGNKTQRQACRDLIEEKGFVDIIAAVEYAIQVFGKPYAPQITTPYELKAKYPKLLIYKNK